jgi:putative tryptophan/tyrosine transport system substrate-binding protein
MKLDHLKRREFITLLGGAAVAWPLAARGQQLGKVPLVGALMPFAAGDEEAERRRNAFQRGLEAFGWTNGQNVRIEYRWVGSDRDRIRNAAIEIVGLKPDVILVSTALILAAGADQHGSHRVHPHYRSGRQRHRGKLGATGQQRHRICSCRVLDVRQIDGGEAAPSLTRVAVVMNPEQAPQAGMLRAVEAVASALGVKTSSLSVRDPIERGFASFAQEQHGGLVVLPNPVADVNRELIVRTATRHGLPAIYAYRYYVASGGLMSLGIDTADQFKQAASYVDRILKGAKPAELPVQQPTKFELVINLKTAKALGIDIPTSVLARADEVIE